MDKSFGRGIIFALFGDEGEFHSQLNGVLLCGAFGLTSMTTSSTKIKIMGMSKPLVIGFVLDALPGVEVIFQT